jgi:pilus assembly protein TadC
MENIFVYIGRILLGKRHVLIKSRLAYAGMTINHFKFAAISLFAGIIITLLSCYGIYLSTNSQIYAVLGLGAAASIYYILLTSYVSMLIDQRARYVETVLPDALQLMAANLRSGLSTDEAVLTSAREEFGFLADKIKAAGEKIATGISFGEAFRTIPENIESDLLNQTVDLIIEGESSGGELSSILESTSIDIRDTAMIQKEVRSVIMVYSLFIFIAIAVIAPILYAVSTQLAGILSSLSRSISVQFMTKNTATLQLAPAMISAEFLTMFSYANLIIISVFGSLMMSLINRGSEKYGLKYIPFVLGLSLLLFYFGRMVMNAFFGGIRVL